GDRVAGGVLGRQLHVGAEVVVDQLAAGHPTAYGRRYVRHGRQRGQRDRRLDRQAARYRRQAVEYRGRAEQVLDRGAQGTVRPAFAGGDDTDRGVGGAVPPRPQPAGYRRGVAQAPGDHGDAGRAGGGADRRAVRRRQYQVVDVRGAQQGGRRQGPGPLRAGRPAPGGDRGTDPHRVRLGLLTP